MLMLSNGNDVFMDCGEKICSMDLYYGDFLTDIWSWVDLIIFSLLPFLLLIESNTIMIWKLTSFVKNARIALSSGQSDPATIRNSRASSLTLTLIFLSITFLFLTMPYSIFLILYDTLDNKIEDEYDLSIFSFLCAFFHLLWCCNSSVNFYLYCLTGSRFRAEFKNILHSFLRKYQS